MRHDAQMGRRSDLLPERRTSPTERGRLLFLDCRTALTASTCTRYIANLIETAASCHCHFQLLLVLPIRSILSSLSTKQDHYEYIYCQSCCCYLDSSRRSTHVIDRQSLGRQEYSGDLSRIYRETGMCDILCVCMCACHARCCLPLPYE